MNKVRFERPNVHNLKDKIVVFYLNFALMYPFDQSTKAKITIHYLHYLGDEQEQEIDNEKTKFRDFDRKSSFIV